MARPNMTLRSLRIPDDLWHAARARAAEESETVSEVVRRALEEYAGASSCPSLTPGRWWRVLASDGSLWAETSRETEAREAVRPGDTLQREYVSEEPEGVWVTVDPH